MKAIVATIYLTIILVAIKLIIVKMLFQFIT